MPSHIEQNEPSAKLRTDALVANKNKSRRNYTFSEPVEQRIKADAVKTRLKIKLRAKLRKELEELVRKMKSKS